METRQKVARRVRAYGHGRGRRMASSAAAPPADAAPLAPQAEIAECLAGEAGRLAGAWALDARMSRGHAPPAYAAGLERMIAAGTDSAHAMDAWADAGGQAAADGVAAAGEASAPAAAERTMADARAAAYEAIASIPAGQRVVATDRQVPSTAAGSRLAPVLPGEGTEWYWRARGSPTRLWLPGGRLRRLDMGVLTICVFVVGAVIGHLYVTSHVLGYFGIITDVVDCGSIDDPAWSDQCGQGNAIARMLIPIIVPVLTGAILASVARMLTGRRL